MIPRVPGLGNLDCGGIPIILAIARDALQHHIDRKHPYAPNTCEGCEFTKDAMKQLTTAIKTWRNLNEKGRI